MADVIAIVLGHIALFSAVLLFAFGVWIYFEKRTDPRHVTFAGFAIAIALWALSGIFLQEAETPFQILFWARTFSVGGALASVTFLGFASALSHERKPRGAAQIALLAALAGLGYAAYATDWIVASAPLPPGIASGTWRMPLAAFGIAAAAAGAFMLSTRKGAERRDSALLVIGTAVAFVGVLAPTFFGAPVAEPSAVSAGIIAAAAGTAVIAFAALKRSFLLDLRLLGIELFFPLAVFLVVTDVVISESLLDFTFRLFFLIVIICYGIVSARTLVGEVRHAKEIETLNEQIMKMNGSLIEADKLKTRFVSFASHQLRSPIGGIRGYLQLFRDGAFGPVTPAQSKILETNIEALRNLLETTESFLNLSKIHSGHFDLYRKDMDMKELVRRVVDEMSIAAARKGLALRSSLASDIPTVVADEGKLYHALLNLVDNAIKYTETGSVTVEISSADGRVRVNVTDTGVGLTAEERDRVFDMFRRGSEAIRLDAGGSGLGLVVMKNIVEGHGGTVSVSSEGRNRGATFGFRIPIR